MQFPFAYAPTPREVNAMAIQNGWDMTRFRARYAWVKHGNPLICAEAHDQRRDTTRSQKLIAGDITARSAYAIDCTCTGSFL